MNLLSDIITYIRRIVKVPTNEELTDALIIDYINRFLLMDVDARIQPFDFKNQYQFQTEPGRDRYNMPLYDVQVQPSSQNIESFPVYQGFMGPAYVNGRNIPFLTEKSNFYGLFPDIVQQMESVGTGDNTTGPYTLTLPISIQNSTPINIPIQSIVRGHVDITGVLATGTNVDPPVGSAFNTSIPSTSVDSSVFINYIDGTGKTITIADSGQFLDTDENYGLLMQVGNAPLGNSALSGGYTTSLNTINYVTGAVILNTPSAVPTGIKINASVKYYQNGIPTSVLYNNNTLTFRTVPDRSYTVKLDAYLTPASMLNTSQAVPFAYMSEYIARGASRKILSDVGDQEQFSFYEPFFLEQEALVRARSTRQKTSTRTQTMYSMGISSNSGNFNGWSQGAN